MSFPVLMKWVLKVYDHTSYSHCSLRLSKYLGTNPVSVLATLFLLSYAKLLRTIISAFRSTFLEYPDGSQVSVWLFDGNI